MFNNEENLDVSISGNCNTIKNAINDWVIEQSGVVVIAQNITEKVMLGFNNCIGPRILVVFVEESSFLDEEISELTGRIRRTFDIVVERPKIMSDPRNTDLANTTVSSRPLYSLIEECRDKLRTIIWPSPMIQNPTEYHGIRPGSQSEWLMNSYIISISIIVDIGRVISQPVELGGNQGQDYIQLTDPLPENQNNP